MLIFCLGTKASGSTWIFNVVREIAARTARTSVSFYSDTFDEFSRNLESTDGLTIVKCHFLDFQLLDLANLANAKLIISSRDPRDSTVSLKERFSFSVAKAANDLSQSFATILSVPKAMNTLPLRYGESLDFQEVTVRKIARFLECDLSGVEIEEISSSLTRDAVAQLAKDIPNPDGDPMRFQPGTHWHPNHVGDGKSDKWKDRLSPINRKIIEDCLLPLYESNDHRQLSLTLPHQIFSGFENTESAEYAKLSCDGGDKYLVWGPYFYLPCGRWRADYLIYPTEDDLTLKIDINEAAGSRGILGLKTCELRGPSINDLSIEFDHLDPSVPVEARIRSIADGQTGGFTFAGVRVTRLGPAPPRIRNSTNRINPLRLK